MTEMVEVQRILLTEEQAHTVRTLSKAVTDHQTKYGQHAFSVDMLRAQFEQNIKQAQQVGEPLRIAIQEASQGLQAFSTRLTEELQLDLNEGQWTLNVEEGLFIQTKSPENISARKKGKTASKQAPKRAAKRTRSRK